MATEAQQAEAARLIDQAVADSHTSATGPIKLPVEDVEVIELIRAGLDDVVLRRVSFGPVVDRGAVG